MGIWSIFMSNPSKVRTISAQVTEPDYRRYAAVANASGKTMSAWIKETLAALYPADMYSEEHPLGLPRDDRAPSTSAPPAIDLPPAQAPKSLMGVAPVEAPDEALDLEDQLAAAFHTIDDHERGMFGEAAVPQRTAAGGTPRAPAAPGTTIAVQDLGHPCAHLSTTLPANQTWADCQGSCMRQHGRPCHWPAQTAPQCSLFRIRRAPL